MNQLIKYIPYCSYDPYYMCSVFLSFKPKPVLPGTWRRIWLQVWSARPGLVRGCHVEGHAGCRGPVVAAIGRHRSSHRDDF